MQMPMPMPMPMRPIHHRHRRRRARPHHHHQPPPRARLVSSVPSSSHATSLARVCLSVTSFSFSFIPLDWSSGDVSDRPRVGARPTRGCVPVSDRPHRDRDRGREDSGDVSCLTLTSHHSSLRPTHPPRVPSRPRRDETRRIVLGGDRSDSIRFRSDGWRGVTRGPGRRRDNMRRDG